MSVKPHDFLQSAINIHAGSNEISHRNAASRAYYSIYNRANELAFPLLDTKGGVHAKLIFSLIKHPDENYRFVGHKLKLCKTLRVSADYKLMKTFFADDATLCIAIATDVHARIDSIQKCLSRL